VNAPKGTAALRTVFARAVAMTVAIAVASLGLVAAQTLGAGRADAAVQNGYVFNDAWTLLGGDQTTKYTTGSNGAYFSASSNLSTSTGNVGITAQFTQDPNRNPSATFLSAGGDQSLYNATANTFIGSPTPSALPALAMYTNSSDGCGGALGTAAHQNFSSSCAVGTLTFAFSRPVTDAVLDISGLGGYSYRFLNSGYARGSFNATSWKIITDGVTFSNPSAGRTNLSVSDTVLTGIAPPFGWAMAGALSVLIGLVVLIAARRRGIRRR